MSGRRAATGPAFRPGFSLTELLVVLALGGLVVAGAASVLGAQRRAFEALALGAEAMEAGRITRRLLHRELRSGSPGLDWTVGPGDSVRLRAYRGWGRVCPEEGEAGTIRIRYRGLRAPNAEKDSLRVLTVDGLWTVSSLESWSWESGECGEPPEPGERDAVLRPGRDVPTPVLVRVFETGSYHLYGDAFRYRIGLGGRQPLTPLRLAGQGTSIRPATGSVELRLAYRPIRGLSRPPSERWRIWRRDEF